MSPFFIERSKKFFIELLNEYLRTGVYLSIFLVWMWSLPLEGYLAVDAHIEHSSLYFIIFQGLSLFVVYLYPLEKIIKTLFKFLVSIVSLFTILIPFMESNIIKIVIISILGVISAPILVYAILFLKKSKNVYAEVSAVFITAFIFQIFLQEAPLYVSFKFIILSLLFSIISFMNVSECVTTITNIVKINNKRVLIVTFYITGGLLYKYIIPYFKRYGFLEIPEHFYYLAGVLIGIFLYKKKRDLPVLFAIVCGILSFSFVHEKNIIFQIISIASLNISFGLIEIFIILNIIKRDLNFKQVVSLQLCMCIGIVVGQLFALSEIDEYVLYFGVVLGNLVLIATLFIFYFTKKDYEQSVTEAKGSVSKTSTVADDNIDIYKSEIVKRAQARLSPRENEILNLMLLKKHIKEISEILNISESTVKTHMSRIYQKLNVRSKSELIDLFLKK